jgi:hypothetical protein
MGIAGPVPRIAWVIHAGVDGATHGRGRPVPSVAAARGLTYLGLDVHRDTISVVVVLDLELEAPTVDRIANDEPSVRRLVAQFPTAVGCEPATRPVPPGVAGGDRKLNHALYMMMIGQIRHPTAERA